VGGESITAEQLSARTDAKLNADQSNYELRLRQIKQIYDREREGYREKELNDLVEERVLKLEAAKRRVSPDVLLAGIKSPAVTDADAHSFYETRKGQIGQPYDKVASDIKDYLEKDRRATARHIYLDALRTKYHAAILLEPLREEMTPSGAALGPADAPVTIVEFSDFQCPYCGRFAPALKNTLRKYPTQVRLVFRNLPLASLHAQAVKAAEAAVCARDQGKFWEMHDLLFAEQKSLGVDALKEKATRLGLDSKTFDDCLDSGKSENAIKTDMAAADQLGITGTPTSFVNGRYLNGAVSENDLSAVIDDELRRAGSKVAR
jgi:protein-disulfide isomerase